MINKTLKLDESKIATILTLIINNTGKRTLDEICEVLYIADYNHLLKYGRTLAGVRYQKNSSSVTSNYLLNFISSNDFFAIENKIVTSIYECKLGNLSKSDTNEITTALSEMNSLDSIEKMNFEGLEDGQLIDLSLIIEKMPCAKDLTDHLMNTPI